MRVAGISLASGVPFIDSLVECQPENALTHKITGNADLYFSVPEKEAIIKRVKIPVHHSLDPEKLALFELAASLIGGLDRFYTETYSLDGRNERLAVAYGRESVDRNIDFFKNQMTRPAGFRLRSLALAAAYKHYFRHDGGELICLLDISGQDLSYCFLASDHPVAAGSLDAGLPHLGMEEPGMKRFLVDMAAVVQYQTALLFKDGFSAPLSLVTLGGAEASEEVAAAIGEVLKVRATLFSPRKEFFPPALLDSAVRYPVSLGLTADL